MRTLILLTLFVLSPARAEWHADAYEVFDGTAYRIVETATEASIVCLPKQLGVIGGIPRVLFEMPLMAMSEALLKPDVGTELVVRYRIGRLVDEGRGFVRSNVNSSAADIVSALFITEAEMFASSGTTFQLSLDTLVYKAKQENSMHLEIVHMKRISADDNKYREAKYYVRVPLSGFAGAWTEIERQCPEIHE